MTHRIVVLGAGYAGASAAGRLARRLHPDDVEITVVNAAAEFVERVRMHQLATTGQDLTPRTLSDMYAGTGVNVRLARVTALDADRKIVALVDENGADEIAYDTLVYALGSAAADHGVPGVAEHAYDVAGPRSALRLRQRLDDLAAGGQRAGRRRGPHRPRDVHRDRGGPARPPRRDRHLGRLRRLARREGPAVPARGGRAARHHRPRAHGRRTRRGERRGHGGRRGDPGGGDRVDGGFRRSSPRSRHSSGRRGERADRRRSNDALGLTPRRVRGR